VRSDQQEEKIHADVHAVGADVREREKTRRRRRRQRRRRGGERRRTIRLPGNKFIFHFRTKVHFSYGTFSRSR
jgi:hypothetical protein